MRVATRNLFTLLPFPMKSNPGPVSSANGAVNRCYHHKRYETAKHRPRTRHRRSRRRAHCRAANCGSCAIRSKRSSCHGTIWRSRLSFRYPGPASSAGRRQDRSSIRPQPQRGYRRLPPSLPSRRRHRLARSHRNVLPVVRSRFRPASLADLAWNGAGFAGLCNRYRGGFSLPGRQFILAGAAPLTMTFGSRFSPAR